MGWFSGQGHIWGKQDEEDVIFFWESEGWGKENWRFLRNKNTFFPRRVCEEFLCVGLFLGRAKQFWFERKHSSWLLRYFCVKYCLTRWAFCVGYTFFKTAKTVLIWKLKYSSWLQIFLCQILLNEMSFLCGFCHFYDGHNNFVLKLKHSSWLLRYFCAKYCWMR